MNEDLDMISFGIIANAGDSRSSAFQALEAARRGEFEEADGLMEKARAAYQKAHKAQTDLLFAEMNGAHKPVNVLMVHSQDHLMNAMLAMELIEEMIAQIASQWQLKKRVEQLEKRLDALQENEAGSGEENS